MSEAARNLAPRFREHMVAMDSQVALMESGSFRILHLNMDVTKAALERAKAARDDLQAIMGSLEAT